MATVPAKKFVNINFNTLPSGGSLINLNGLFLTDSTLLPNGTLRAFSNAEDVALVFGSSSVEFSMATVYFNGFSIATTKPGKIYFYRVSGLPTRATLTGGSLSMTLSQLQALASTTMTITVDGITSTSSAMVWSGVTSFSDAAIMMTAAFTYPNPPNFTIEWHAPTSQFIFTSLTSGVSSTITQVSGGGAAITSLLLTTASGAVAVQGTNGSSTAGSDTMDTIVNLTSDWATFTTTYEPSLAIKKQFATWVSARNAEYAYICWDTDSNSTVVNPALDNIYNYLQAGALDNTFIVTKQSTISTNLAIQAAFVSGVAASIDFQALNNRPTFAFKQQAGLVPGVNNQSLGDAIETNGGNYYVDTSTKNTDFKFLFPGQVSGAFKWMDDLVNAIYMKATMQNTLMTLLTNVASVPYNQQGYQGLIATSLIGDINGFINYGAIRTGVVLSGVQVAALTNRAGRDISNDLFNRGFVLDVLDPGAIVRTGRGSPIINLYYTSGGAVHKINLTATLVQ